MHVSADGVAVLQTKERSSGLGGGVEIGGGESEGRKAEGVGGVCLLCGDDAAAGPLISAIAAGEGYGADNAVAIDDGSPHVEVEAAVWLQASGGKCGFECAVGGELVAGGAVVVVVVVVGGCASGLAGQENRGQSGRRDSERLRIVHVAVLSLRTERVSAFVWIKGPCARNVTTMDGRRDTERIRCIETREDFRYAIEE